MQGPSGGGRLLFLSPAALGQKTWASPLFFSPRCFCPLFFARCFCPPFCREGSGTHPAAPRLVNGRHCPRGAGGAAGTCRAPAAGARRARRSAGGRGGGLFEPRRVAGPGRPALPFGAGRNGAGVRASWGAAREAAGSAHGKLRGVAREAARETGYVGNPFVNRRLFCPFVGLIFIVGEKSCAMWGKWCCRAQRASPWWGALCGILPVIPVLWGLSPIIFANFFCLWGSLAV